MGVEPNFGCCTANFNQGWPKLGLNAIFTYAAGGPGDRPAAPAAPAGIAVGVFLPAKATVVVDGVTIVVTIATEYPFGDVVEVTVEVPADGGGGGGDDGASGGRAAGGAAHAIPLKIRIPGWASNATVSSGGATASRVANGTMVTVPGCCHRGAKTSVTVELNPEIEVETGWGSRLPYPGWPAGDGKNHTVVGGFAHFSGAVAAGGDLRHDNVTFAEATAWCSSSPECVSITFGAKPNGTEPTAKVSTCVDTAHARWRGAGRASGDWRAFRGRAVC